MSDHQIIKDGEQSPSIEKSPRKRSGKAQAESTKASTLFAKVLNMGSTPVNPAEYLRILIGRVHIPSKDDAENMSVHQFVEEIKEAGINTQIDTTDGISSLILAIEAEYNADVKVICSVLLYLVSKSRNYDRTLEIDNLIWGFAATDKREEFVKLVCSKGSSPIYTKTEYPNISCLDFDAHGWNLFFNALISILCHSGDPHGLYHSFRTEWLDIRQKEKIKTFLFEEAKSWSKLVAQCRIIKRQPPSDDDRMEKIFDGLNAETQRVVKDRLSKYPSNPDLNTLFDMLSTIDERKERTFPWEKQPASRGNERPSRSRCPHCKYENPKHSEEECSKNPKNETRKSEKKQVTLPNKTSLKTTYPVEAVEEEPSEESVSFSITKSSLPCAILQTDYGPSIVVAFDSCSSITLISPTIVNEKNSLPKTSPLTVKGFGGTQTLMGEKARVFLKHAGRRFNVTGYVGPPPEGVDLLIGIPQLKNMGLILDFSQNIPCAVISNLNNLKLPLSSGSAKTVMHMQQVRLPELSIEIDQQACSVPYQHPTGYPVPTKYKTALRAAISKEIQLGHLEEVKCSPSFWISPLFVKVKADGTVRLLADLRLLNKHIKNPGYWAELGPHRSKFQLGVSGRFFSKIDISSAFHSCPVSPASQHLLVVRVDGKLYQYKTAPQGLSSSALFWPLHLAAGLDQTCGDSWRQWASVYVDDILVTGDSESVCVARTEQLLAALTHMGKQISPKSVTKPCAEMECIGLLFTQSGARISDSSVDKLRKALRVFPKDLKGMRTLIGALQYARSAINLDPVVIASHFSNLIACIRKKKFNPTEEARSSVTTLSQSIESITFGYVGSNSSHLIVVTDASDHGCGAALYRTESPPGDNLSERIDSGVLLDIDIHSLSPQEQRWQTFEKENYSLYRAAIKWRDLFILCGGSITFATDSNTALGQWKNQDSVITTAKARRFANWSLEVAFLNALEVNYVRIPGDINSLADLFSRYAGQPDLPLDEEIWASHTQILPASLITQVLDAQNAENIPTDQRSKDGKLNVPSSCLRQVIRQIHNAFHYGRRETLFHFQAHFASKEAHKVVAEVCSSCDCYAAKATRRDVQPMGTLKTDSLPFAEVCMDTVGPIKTKQHQAYIVTTLCRSTLYVTFSVVPDIQARTLAETLCSVFYNYSFPTTLTCDNFPSHKSQTFVDFAQQNQIKIVYTPIFAAHRNGLLERQHRVLGEVLRFYLLSKGKNWVSQIPKIQARINDRTIGTTDGNRRITPFRLVHGFSFRAPGMPPEEEPSGEYDDLMDRIKSIEMTEESSRRFNGFISGQRVLRYAPIVNLEQSSKLNVKFKPSTVTQVLGKVTYQCTDDDGTIAICDGRNLRKIHSSTSNPDNAVGGAM